MHIIDNSHEVYVVGDYHSNRELFEQRLELIDSTPASIIFLGDYGVTALNDLISFRDLMSYYDLDCFLLRGNHDNPEFWQDKALAGELSTESFKLINEIDVIEWRGVRMLTISGAISVDRKCIRAELGHCWPKLEAIPKDALKSVNELVSKSGGFDLLLSHTGTIDGVSLDNEFVRSYASTDEFLIEDLQYERHILQQLLVSSGATMHIFGHFHRSWVGECYGVRSRCLDICELIPLKGD